MSSPVAGALRLARAGSLAVTAFALTSVAHVVAGGVLPATPWMVSIFLVTLCGSVVVTGRRLGRGATVAGLGVSQMVLHAAFAFLSPGGSCTRASSGLVMHSGHEAVMRCSDPAMTMPVHHSTGVVMGAAHAVAAVLVGLVLARGEAAVWFLASLVWPGLPSRVQVVPAASAPRVAVRPRPAARQLFGTGGLGLRGPPLALSAAAHQRLVLS
jgi:hypothetical protein